MTARWYATCPQLADRFVEHLGVPPMMYLARWRMQIACELLASEANLTEVAAAVGVAPATWRARRQRAWTKRAP